MFSIRNATRDDIPLIRELCYEVWPQTYATILSQQQIAYMLELMYSESSLQKQMEDGVQFLVVYDDHLPVGYAAYQQIKDSVFKLHKIYVLPSQQGKGTGKLIVDHITQVIRNLGATALQLQVNRNNSARSFYEKLGFHVVEEIKLDIGNGFVMDDYVMEKQL